MRIWKSLMLLTAVLFVMAGCGSQAAGYKPIATVQEFKFTDQEGKPFGLEDLKGKVWVANFIFTSCTTVCPPMTAHMKKLQTMADDQGIKLEIVSFSVDPEIDNPEKLKQFAGQFGSSFDNWHFLTGYSQKEIETFSLNSFKTLVKKPESEDQVIHGTSFYVVDKEGKAVKSYSGIENTPYNEILKDVQRLQDS
ncbi:redoxin family protein [Bacillus mangrovi]|uniref:Redoxin family protein n=1 Tax=Metabacillus mangrovi TaxID=1491830 RepID=A0A7X2V3I9_9BACI|nr:SCO family protein [Metabacillus mangrovi]MTH52066.1 redoxin family protein [Metabacillus mangrovi]